MLETTVDWAPLDVGRLAVVVAIVVGQRKVCGDQERSERVFLLWLNFLWWARRNRQAKETGKRLIWAVKSRGKRLC